MREALQMIVAKHKERLLSQPDMLALRVQSNIHNKDILHDKDVAGYDEKISRMTGRIERVHRLMARHWRCASRVPKSQYPHGE